LGGAANGRPKLGAAVSRDVGPADRSLVSSPVTPSGQRSLSAPLRRSRTKRWSQVSATRVQRASALYNVLYIARTSLSRFRIAPTTFRSFRVVTIISETAGPPRHAFRGHIHPLCVPLRACLRESFALGGVASLRVRADRAPPPLPVPSPAPSFRRRLFRTNSLQEILVTL
jgi:hypothetical protein